MTSTMKGGGEVQKVFGTLALLCTVYGSVSSPAYSEITVVPALSMALATSVAASLLFAIIARHSGISPTAASSRRYQPTQE